MPRGRGYGVATIERFGGLNLQSSPDEVGSEGAIDLLNVEFGEIGSIRSRDGVQAFSAEDGQCLAMSPFIAGGHRRLALDCLGTVKVLDGNGAQVGSDAALSTYVEAVDFARFGTPTAEKLYIAHAGQSLQNLVLASGTPGALQAPATQPYAHFIGVTPTDNRMVAARCSHSLSSSPATLNDSMVRFSSAGDAETWPVNNFVQLTPGDGEPIMGMQVWRELLFVFKRSRFFVFYSPGTDAQGNPIFNYRPVDAGVGLSARNCVCAATDGVYFLDRRGLYRTTGGQPELVSGDIDGVFTGRLSRHFGLGSFDNSQNASITERPILHAFGERIFFCGRFTAGRRSLVYDARVKQWSAWSLAPYALTNYQPDLSSGREELYLAKGVSGIQRLRSGQTTDDGTAIRSHYQAGFQALGEDAEASVRQHTIWGKGNVHFQTAVDLGDLGVATQVGLGTSQVEQDEVRFASRGRLLSWKVSDVDGGAWQMDRLSHHLRSARAPGSRSVR